MTDRPEPLDVEAELDHAALVHAARQLLRQPPASTVDHGTMTSEVSSAIQRAWIDGVPPAEHHDAGWDPGHGTGDDPVHPGPDLFPGHGPGDTLASATLHHPEATHEPGHSDPGHHDEASGFH